MTKFGFLPVVAIVGFLCLSGPASFLGPKRRH